MLPYWLLLSVVATTTLGLTADDGTFLSAMKNLFFGTEQYNGTQTQLLSSSYSHPTFHQFSATNGQSSGSACMMPQQIGTGPYRIPRWYFNPARGRCELFYWSGCCGNGNNFQTFQNCQSTCEESPNPCAVSVGNTINQCTPGVSTCGSGSFCHVGATPQTTACCPKPAPIDRCQQPLNVGVGNANLQRWYFNPLTQQCQPCIYRGLQGNENNFLTKQECENSCLVNPCKIGAPFRAQGVIVQCSAMNPNVCPANHYCHIGADTTTTVCCQALEGSNPCAEPWTKGEGDAALTRFYYDALQRKCLTFNYFGTKGNQNNFVTRESCEAACPVWINPCAIGQPTLTSDQQPFKCHQGASCSPGYYCHIGFDETTTACCSSQGDPCSLIVNEGKGPHSIQRWFYNQQTHQCQSFIYQGMAGNENNFLLREHCESTCPVWVNVCPQGEPYLVATARPQQCDPSNEDSCPITHWCHPGPDSTTTMCCPGRVDPCTRAKSEGEGPLQLTRYYFDAAQRQCLQFSFRGIRGNANNFLTKENCEARCPVQVNPCPVTMNSLKSSVGLTTCSPTKKCPETQWCHIGATKETTVCCPNALPSPCTAPPRNPGEGPYHATRWAFDGTSRKCVPFEYRGMRGNANNFLTREDCEQRCPVFTNPCKLGEPYASGNVYYTCSPTSLCPKTHYCHVGADANYCCPVLGTDPCSQPYDRGNGGAQLQRWYWNLQSQSCIPFSYCGTKGTQNNFLSKSDCERTCYVLDNPCALGQPQMTVDNRPQTCSPGSNMCAAGFWCHIGSIQKTTVCCPGRVEGQAICQQPLALGNGDDALPRWYYDAASMRCVQFFYRGRYGNQNNFLSQYECEQACPVFNNPCNQPIPLPPQMCSASAMDTCGPNAWCHIGATPETTVCCPNEGDPCSLPLNRGTGNSFVDRWYFNQQSGTCQPFSYAGTHGNQNNFLTRESCEERCGPNPCFEGRPFAGVDGRPQTCSISANLNTCPASYWCHIGADITTTVCCPGASTNICNLPMSTGDGNYNLERFYFDQSSRTCRPFIYNGLKGNQNNFITLRACQLACQPLDNPCIGQPATTAAGQVLFCSPTNKDTCPVNFWCHIGATPETTVCCPGATNACSVPLAPGTGNAGLSRWYYNPDDRQCLPFQYNGKRGNQNNFETQTECERTCPEELCLLSIDRGACGGRQTRYAFNRQTSQCVPFDYTGCGGNLNNFVTMMDCMATCGNVGFRR
ncbi:hypothetical protein RB195_012807 [Necator americanus]|uniref:BPTI/Kunitz inhibitor domain-containing protein n=1 Tax=Necator americanus TaxID=51031 RepID=A0ABR1DSN5_NECAM